MKICIIGHGRHGKDTVAEILNAYYGMEFKSSSLAASEIFIFECLKDVYNYKTPEECYEDRSNKRKEWYDLICEFNFFDKTALAREIVKDVDCYVGMRDRDEIEACIKHNIFDLIIWVDACERLPLEPKDSFNIDKSCADIIIDNNYDLDSLYKKVIRLGKTIFKK